MKVGTVTRLCLYLSVLSSYGAYRASSQEGSALDTLSARVTTAIHDSLKDAPIARPRVLVVDFEEDRGPISELGHALTREFVDSLQKHAQGFVILTRDELEQKIIQNNLPDGLLSNSAATDCFASELGADVLIRGNFEYSPAGIVLWVGVERTKPHKSIFSRWDNIIPMTNSMTELAAEPAPPSPPISTHEPKVWVSRDHPPLSDDKVAHLLQPVINSDYTPPSCVKCPAPPFSDDAVIFKYTGTVRLRVQISAEGFPSEISLMEGQPCGLTDQAFEAVEHWKFKPAMAHNGTPAAETSVEMTFRLN